MKKQLQELKEASLSAINGADSIEALESLRVKFLGKKGELTAILKQMGKLLTASIDKAHEVLAKKQLSERLERETIDVTIPGTPVIIGKKHPLTAVLDEVKEICVSMGFTVVEGPEVEYSVYNFDKLNTSEGHPARDRQDTFYFTDDDRVLLRTQTSPVQVHVMETQPLPIRIVSPGRVYRKDEVDATHSPMFHQFEALVVDKGITMGDLKGTLNTFTEPSCEGDVQWFECGGKGCRVCKGEGWIELLGAGMVHPKVLEICGIDSKEYSGFAFGMGVERMAMRRFNISDLRLIYENDLRFLEQF